MVLVGRKFGANKSNYFVGRRKVGQANNNNAAFAQQQQQGLVGDNTQVDEDVFDLNPNAVDLPETDTLNQIEAASNTNQVTSIDPVTGERIIAIQDLESGVQVIERLPAQAPPAQEENVCEFPAQAVQLQRHIDIVNTAPEILNVDTDVCGNVTGYTEQMTRTLTAGPWVPVNGLGGPFGVQNVNGLVEAQGGAVIANSRQVPQGATITSQTLVGGRRRNVGGSNRNAKYGSSVMKTFRSA